MRIKRNIKLGLIACSIFALAGSFVACDTNKEPELQSVYAINAQLKRFALAVKQDTKLASIPFSINNSAPEGVIENVEPLPYGMTLDKVTLVVTPNTPVAKVSIALGESSDYEEWTATKEYNIGDVTSMRLRVTLDGERGDKYEYTYRVNLRRYKFDPETIEWSNEVIATPPRLEQGYNYALTRDDDVLIIHGSLIGNYFYSHRGDAFETLKIPGIPLGGRIVQASSLGKIPYVRTSQGGVYYLTGDIWSEVPILGKVRSLLGVLAPRQAGGEPRLALIIEENGQEVFASYEGGKLSTRHRAVPEDFPRDGGYSFSTSKTYIGEALTLVGESNVSGVPTQSTWYTTDLAEDWLKISAMARPDRANATPASIFQLDDTLYRLETVGGLSVYTSTDGGKRWIKNGDKALPEAWQTLAGSTILGYRSPEHTIYLLGRVNTEAGATHLLKGRPKSHDL